MTDTERLDWLECHPRLAQINVNGQVSDCVMYAIAAMPGVPLRAVIDAAIEAERSALQ